MMPTSFPSRWCAICEARVTRETLGDISAGGVGCPSIYAVTAVLLLKTYSPMPWLDRMASWKHLAARVLRLAKDRLS
jgi:hypothetical protein